MASIIIRGRRTGRAYNSLSSFCKRSISLNLFNKNDAVESSSSFSINFLRTLASSTSANDFDNLFPSDVDPNPRKSTPFRSNGPPSPPPNPIPNRPLRGGDNNRRRSSPQQHKFYPKSLQDQFNPNPNQDMTGAEFLNKFKLGFEEDASNESINKAKIAAAESEPSEMPQDADEIFKKMKETGAIPNAVVMLDGLCKDGLVKEAMKLFGLMREKGTIPEVIIYTAVVEGFCRAHKFDDAIRIFRKMQSNNVVPNAYSYGLVVRWLCTGKRLDDAVAFCVEALEAGHSLNLATFTSLVNVFCTEKGVEEAKGVIATLRVKGFSFDEKAAREYLDKKGPFSPAVWEAIIGRKASTRSSLFD